MNTIGSCLRVLLAPLVVACLASTSLPSSTRSPSADVAAVSIVDPTLTVNPDGVIGAVNGAKISHNGTTTVVITAENEDGNTETFEVPPGTTIHWVPPAGWKTVTFSGCGDKVFRVIDPDTAPATSR